MIKVKHLRSLLISSRSVVLLIGSDEQTAESGQALVAAYNKAKSRASSIEVAATLNLSDAELLLFEASLRDFAKRYDAIDGEEPERTTIISALRLISWLETIQKRGVSVDIPDFSGLPVDEEVGRKQVRALELILRSLVAERFGTDLETKLKSIIKPELVDKWKASGDPDDLLSGTTFSELASLVVNKDEFSHYSKLYSHESYLNYLRDRRKTVQNFLDDVRRVRNVLAHNKSISDAQLQLLELYYEELTSPVQDAFDNGETEVDPSTYFDVSREELQSYFVDLKEDIASVQDELADFRASVEGDLGVIKEDTADIRQTSSSVKRRTTMIAAGVVALIVLVGGSYVFLTRTKENTEAILGDTATIKQTTTETNQAITEVQESSKRIEGSLDSIQKGFETLSQSGGVIQNAERPEHFYNNARVYEDRGDYLNARKSYNEFFKFQLEVLDPYLRYSTFLKVQEGRQGAIEVFGSLLDKFPTKSGKLAKILLENNPKRTELLKSFAAENSDYAPANYYLAEQYSEKVLGTQSLEDKAREHEALSAIPLESLAMFFIDKSMVSEISADVDLRLKANALFNAKAVDNPVTLTGNLSNQGWMLNVQIAEVARSISYAFKLEDTYQDNGYLEYVDPRTGNKMPNPMITLPNDAQKQSIFVKYKNINEKIVGPYEVVFDPEPMLINSQIQTAKMISGSLVRFISRTIRTQDASKIEEAKINGYEPTLNETFQLQLKSMITFENVMDFAKLTTDELARLEMSMAEFNALNRSSPGKARQLLVNMDSQKYDLNKRDSFRVKKNELEEAYTTYQVSGLSFSGLMSYRCGVEEVIFGANDQEMNHSFKLPKCNPIDPYRHSAELEDWVMVPKGMDSATVKLKFKDKTFEVITVK